MKTFFTLLFLCSFSSLFSQVYTSSCIATPQMVNIYRNDAVKTATHRLFEINSTFKDSINIPTIYIDSIARVFYAINNMPAISLKDTILNLFGFQNFSQTSPGTLYEFDSLHIHNNGFDSLFGASVKFVMMDVRDTTTWALQWQMGNYSNTVNPKINQLVLNYGLTTQNIYAIGGYIHIECFPNRAVNTYGLSKSFNSIIGNPSPSEACKPKTFVGDGNSIQLVYQADGIKITYSNRCGDCFNGCLYGRSWSFKVYYANCNVEYLGAVNLGSPSQPGSTTYTCTRGPVLPITFGSINGYLRSGQAALSWKVLTQVNVKEYVIERSDNGQQFYTAGTVAATHALTADYAWKDVELLTGTAWYRIKAVDLDGKFKYSSIVKISGVSKGNSFIIYPNPVVGRTFTIQFGTLAAGQMKANLYSIDGKKVWASTLSLAPQTVSRTLVLPAGIAPGIYALVVEDNSGSYRQTLVISD